MFVEIEICNDLLSEVRVSQLFVKLGVVGSKQL